MDSLLRATEDPTYPVHWEQIQYKGAKTPGRISHHKCAVQGDKMILVGGNRAGGETGQAETWIFDLKNNSWEGAKLSVILLNYNLAYRELYPRVLMITL
jgi:hypothetical protein